MRRSRTFSTLMLVAAGLCAAVPDARAQDGTGQGNTGTSPPLIFDAVEEDWELVILQPDLIGVGPQITTCMSPVAGNPSPFFVAFNLNYRERPHFLAGGMQVQVWAQSQVVSASSSSSAQFATPGETVQWTQRMWLLGGLVLYDINNGQSTTWGAFGSGWDLATVFPASVSSLEGYDPDASVRTSGAGWESNLVTRLTLARVRYYQGGQLLWTDTRTRQVVNNVAITGTAP